MDQYRMSGAMRIYSKNKMFNLDLISQRLLGKKIDQKCYIGR